MRNVVGVVARVLQLLLLLGVASAWQEQKPQEPPKSEEAPAIQELRERATLYYRLIQKDKPLGALELVAPDSREDFFHMNYRGVVDFQVLGVELDDAGKMATVNVRRTRKVRVTTQLVDYAIKDKWKLIDGQWYIVLPSTKELETPYGKLRLGEQQTPRSESEVEKEMKERTTNIDPDQYEKALDKAIQRENKAKTEAKKPDAKAPETTSGDNPNPKE